MSAQEVLEFDPPPVLEASPFRIFTRKEWSGLRNGVEIPLTDEDWRGFRASLSASAAMR